MTEFNTIPFTILQKITAQARQEKMDVYVKKAYQRILKQANKGEYEYKMWMVPDEKGQLDEDSMKCITRVKELFPGISLTQETTPSNEIVCTFSWRTKSVSQGDSITDILQGQRDIAASMETVSSLLAAAQQTS